MILHIPEIGIHTVGLAIGDQEPLQLPVQNGMLRLPAIPPEIAFSVINNGERALTTTISDLKNLESSVKVISATTCRSHDDLEPTGRTTQFFQDDQQVVFLASYEGVSADCPVWISWHYGETLVYANLVVLPRQGTDSRRVHGTGIYLMPNTPKGAWRVESRLLTGRLLYNQPFTLVARKRLSYGLS